MGFVYKGLWILKALWIILSETIHILGKLQQKINFSGYPPKSIIGLCTLLNLNLPFKWILLLKGFKVLMSEVRMLHVFKDWWKFIQIHPYYTMALIKYWPCAKLHSFTITFGESCLRGLLPPHIQTGRPDPWWSPWAAGQAASAGSWRSLHRLSCSLQRAG